MRHLLFGLAIFSSVGFAFAACGHEPGTAATSAGSSSAGGTGGAPNCEGIYFVYDDKDGSDTCDICLHDHCCPQIADCRDDKDCIDCVNELLPSCGPKPRAVSQCLYAHCQAICSPGWPPTATSAATGG
jgi:hypothetical protein